MNKDEIAGLIEEARLDARDRLCPKLHRRTKPMTEAERMAAGLSDLEREWITGWQGPAGAAFNAVAGDLRRMGLLKGPTDWNLNTLGLAVRKVLERSNG